MAEVENALLMVFDPTRAEIAKFKERDAVLVFEHNTPKGEKDLRSYVRRLRQLKTQVSTVHKEAKAKALAACRLVDGEKKELLAEVESIIDVRTVPLKAIDERKAADIAAIAEEERAEEEAARQAREAIMAQQEADIAAKEAELQAREAAARKAEDERLAKIKYEEGRLTREREILEAEKRAEAEAKRREQAAKELAEQAREDAIAKAESDKIDAANKAEADKQAAIEAEKEKARQVERDRLAKETAELAERDRLARIAQERVADETHRENVEKQTWNDLFVIIENSHKMGAEIITDTVTHYIKNGEIANVTITY